MGGNSQEKHVPRKLYFAYGSNLYKHQMRSDATDDPLSGEYTNRCPDSLEVCTYVLRDHRLAFVGERTGRWGPGGVATVIPSPGDEVHGALYRISPADEDILDSMENFIAADPQSGSYGKDETTATHQGEPVMFYIATERQGGENPPSEMYLETIRRGYGQWGLPLEALNGVEPVGPDAG